ncbi:hypothetical protein [Apibacter sp. HY039]|uniref:imm11 family protein n=1 Tax=Apibacter sp. HY039 TaxID=2501476 RepID=UPI000FEB935B|nr:hypothetical protein [Apibacter sp. HY039]
MSDFEYYIMKSKEDQAYPMIDILEFGNESIQAQIGEPVPRNPVMADFLTGAKDFVTKPIAKVMQALDMKGVQFTSVELSDLKGGIIEDYICIDVNNNTYEALDKEKTVFDNEFDDDDDDDDFYFIKKMVLDRKALQKIPLQERLGFRLYEAPGYYLYHKSVIDEIKKMNPSGVTFVNIEEYEF